MNVLIISGSPALKSRSSALLDYAQQWLSQFNLIIQRISVNEFDASVLLQGKYQHAQIQKFIQQVKEADGIIIASQVYQSSYSGVLKAVIDLLPQRSLLHKTVLPIMTGGSEHHQLALDYAFKPLLTALKAQEIISGIYTSDQHFQYSENTHQYLIFQEIIERLNSNLQAFYHTLNKNYFQHINYQTQLPLINEMRL